MKKQWKYIEYENCPECGNELKVLTDCEKDGMVYDGEEVRCVECDFESTMSVDEDGNAWVAEVAI